MRCDSQKCPFARLILIKAIRVNIIGTFNLVQAIIKKEKVIKKEIRFIFISTDGVYESKNGFYSEDGPTVPYNQYGWSKLSAECAVRMLKNHLVLRTRFYDSKEIPYENSANDMFTSSVEIKELVLAINQLAFIDLKGVINIGVREIIGL
jgi:dTDP-4-dehydrorhamnose reductase